MKKKSTSVKHDQESATNHAHTESHLAVKQQSSKYSSRIMYGMLAVLIGASLFSAGWGFGSGKIKVSKEEGLVVQTNATPSGSLDYASVDELYKTLKDKYDGELDDQKLLDGMKEGLAKASGDPYTEYFNEKAAKEFDEALNGSFTGIGAELGKDANNNVVVISPIAGFPAEKAGLRAKDIIVEIDDKPALDITVSDAVKKIRGPKGTKVKLKVARGGEALTFEITRDQITIASVESKILDGNIGYMRISRFGEDTASLAQKAAQDFKSKNVSAVILDLRGDPGGLLDAAVSVSSLWLKDDAVILKEKRGGKVIQTYKSNGDATLLGVKTVVLIDAGSASASEITAGALKDNGAAQLVGEKSYGKGSVQTLQCLDKEQLLGKCNGDLLKVTVARWYTPNDRNIDKEGIEPDVSVKMSDEDIKSQNDTQKAKAIELVTN